MLLPSAYSAILGGGQSRRFGRDKVLMTLHGRGVLDILVDTLSRIFAQVFFVSDVRDKFHGVDITTVMDDIPGQGPLGGIHAALGVGDGDYCFVTACDTPFLHEKVIRCLWEEIDGEDVIVPVYRGNIEPLVGFYARRCREQIEKALAKGQRKVRLFWDPLQVRYVNLDDRFPADYLEKVFWNINTATDFTIARKWYQEFASQWLES
jgi:molybdopterin-guanine dinucleotide biosynthesis protein A